MRHFKNTAFAGLIAGLLFSPFIAGEAQAIIIGGAVTGGTASTNGGTFVQLFPPIGNPLGAPNSVGNDTFNNYNLYGFNESQNAVVGPAGLATNIPSGTLAAGTVVASHYIFFDPQSGTQIGWVDFDAPILAIMTQTGTLAASDYLANTGVNYLNPSLRGLESGDSAVIDGTLNYRLNVNWSASTPGDYVRVLTAFSPGAAVPETGSTLLMMGCALLALDQLRRRNR